MKTALPIAYSPVDESGFSFHIRNHMRKQGKNISMPRIARLWWIARNSPYISGAWEEMKVDEISLVRRINSLSISDKTLREDLEILRSAGIIIDVITSDEILLSTQYKKQHAEAIKKLCQESRT